MKLAWARAASDRARAATVGTPGGHGYRSAQHPEQDWDHSLRPTSPGAHLALWLLGALGCRARRVLGGARASRAGTPSSPTLRPCPSTPGPTPSPPAAEQGSPSSHLALAPAPTPPAPRPTSYQVVAASTVGETCPMLTSDPEPHWAQTDVTGTPPQPEYVTVPSCSMQSQAK